jgi:hypothetical protein
VDAKEVSARFESKYPSVKLYGIIKEVAPVKGAATDELLGVDKFQTDYFNSHPIYIDRNKEFYKFLGDKSIITQGPTSWNPFSMISGFMQMTDRFRSVEGNMLGEGLLKGGLIIITPEDGGTVVFRHGEHMGAPFPYDEIDAVLQPLLISADDDTGAGAAASAVQKGGK